ncbi:MAG: hypothetical protein HGB03_04160 [Candidatus Yonathbacteria bacterium]|nr:hypothetical protein [Candidatus Yonathbacteria bacterium]NTW47577.1 hypothetical protein [Candidatus Yonathbacteria bacterium]
MERVRALDIIWMYGVACLAVFFLMLGNEVRKGGITVSQYLVVVDVFILFVCILVLFSYRANVRWAIRRLTETEKFCMCMIEYANYLDEIQGVFTKDSTHVLEKVSLLKALQEDIYTYCMNFPQTFIHDFYGTENYDSVTFFMQGKSEAFTDPYLFADMKNISLEQALFEIHDVLLQKKKDAVCILREHYERRKGECVKKRLEAEKVLSRGK